MKTYTCESCGAKLLVSEISHVSTCLYCGNTIVIHNEQIDNLNIQKIIPFTIEKEEAMKKAVVLTGDKIVDAKKVYVPVKFSNYHYDYLYYFEYRVEHEDEHGNTSYSYHDADILLDGDADKEIIFGSSRIKNVYMDHEYRKQPVIDYNPTLVEDVSIEIVNFDHIDFPKQQEERIKEYARRYFSRYDICKVYSENYFLSDTLIDDYTTLIPVYIVKTEKNALFNVPGIRTKMRTRKEFPVITSLLIVFLGVGLISAIALFDAILFFNPFVIFTIGIMIFYLFKNGNSKYNTFEGFKTKEIRFSPKRKRLK